MQTTVTSRWDTHFLQMALLNARLSKDPSTKVGAIITTKDNYLISAGFNGLPRGLEDSYERLNDRELKIPLVVHAEMNSVLAAAKIGITLKDTVMYTTATDKSGTIWGGICQNCAKHIIQVGISKVVTYNTKYIPDRWRKDMDFAKEILQEANIEYVEHNITMAYGNGSYIES